MATENTLPTEGQTTGADGGADELSLREQIEAAFENEPTDEVAAPAAPGGDRARDDKGRFAPKGEAPAAAPAAAPATMATPSASPATQAPAANLPPPAPAPGELKAPAAWRPEVREKWGALDPEVRAEVNRRESEMQRVLQNGAQARQFVDAFERLVQPYEVFIRAENSNPLQAVDNLMRTAAELRVGTPASKAQLVAGLIQNFGIDVQMLDSILAGQRPQAQQQQQQVFHDPRVDQLLAREQRMHQENDMRMQQQIAQELSTFAEKHEFYGDVQQLMADLVEMKGKRGEPIDLEKIYTQACQMHEGVSTILAQRASAQRTGNHSQAVLRAKRAAASVKGDPTPEGATVPKDDSVRASIEAAIEQVQGT